MPIVSLHPFVMVLVQFVHCLFENPERLGLPGFFLLLFVDFVAVHVLFFGWFLSGRFNLDFPSVRLAYGIKYSAERKNQFPMLDWQRFVVINLHFENRFMF